VFSLVDAATALDARRTGADAEVRRVVIDSRRVQAGDLFVALSGERVDGHDYVDGALAAGAAGAIVSDPARVKTPDAPLLVVPDPRLALGRLGAWWRGRLDPVVIGVTGSNGKTTLKEMLAAVIRAHAGADAVLATEGNLNNDLGVPLMLLRLTAQHRYAVLEMGMNHLGEIRYLTGLARPHVAVINNAGTAHIGELGSRENIARAKGEIFEGLGADGVKVINADDDFRDFWLGLATAGRTVTFGMDRPADFGARWEPTPDGSLVTLLAPGGSAVARLHVPGVHNVRNALAAATVAHTLGMPLPAIAAGLAAYGGTKGRMQRRIGPAGCVVIDDTYNANPDSMKAALDWLATQPGRRIFVMGDMGELGDGSDAMHAEVGRHAAAARIDGILALGAATTHTVAAFGPRARHFNQLESLVAAAAAESGAGTTLLVKGSRFMQMERVVARLVDDKQAMESH
jgi:UDP-N-acetylmuramoyl-tripeptide--D-alanyl-D-alanine ligase